jgi:hypothetical protein
VIYLKDVLPIDLLNKHMEEGVIRRQVHPDYPELFIYNYTEQAQFNRIWDAATNVCRGLIVTADGVVVARGFNKFHNLNTEYAPETKEENLPKEAPLVTTKLDGSLGIIYLWDDQWRVATRGSFASEQAKWATDWYRRNGDVPSWPDLVTPVFEVIYSENRIVVDYDFEGLVLLGMVDNETGVELAREDVEIWAKVNGVRIVDRFDKSLSDCAAEDNPNEEGYVLTYSNGVKVKVKFNEYVRLHRILTGLNPKAIWELLAHNQIDTANSWLQDAKMPETFKNWLSGWMKQLQARYAEIDMQAKEVFTGKPGGARKDDAIYFTKTAKHLTGVLFKMLDGKDYADTIWDMIKPKATDTFKVEGE